MTLDDIKARCATNDKGCWIWQGSKNNGYGATGRGPAHRLALTLASGEPPTPKHHAAHGECHERACCNPEHLSWKTHERQWRAKLTEEQVRLFKLLDGHPDLTMPDHARFFGVNRTTLYSIRSGANWAHV
jgi:hypothetical protein